MPDPIVPTPPLLLKDLTEAKIDGTGAFDVLMKASSKHLDSQFDQNKLRGADYAQVYLGGMQAILQNAVVFLLQKDEAANKANLVAQQVELAKLQQQMLLIEIERETLNKELIAAQVEKVQAETTSITESLRMEVGREQLNKDLLGSQAEKVQAETVNLVSENDNIKAQLCLLQAQFDLTMLQKLQTTAQTSLIQQKVATEKAQIVETGVDANSVIGKQKALYTAQSDGFKRDAEQKAAKIFTDTWNVRRTTDDGTVADSTNGLHDANIGRAMAALLTGVGA